MTAPRAPERRLAKARNSAARALRARRNRATAAATRVILTAQLAVVLFMAAAGPALLALFGPQYAVGYAARVLLALAEAVNGAFGVSLSPASRP